mmetsp:Transcript_55156/g.134017  ORF Transcript_55156/g.134017 Transcript_55156/m.134017 type:complete len:819 (+) Transcript_55156:73-2529(+)
MASSSQKNTSGSNEDAEDAGTHQKQSHRATTTMIKFVPFTSSVEVPFWVRYSQLKLETIKLDESPIVLESTYGGISVGGGGASASGGSPSVIQIHEMGLKLDDDGSGGGSGSTSTTATATATTATGNNNKVVMTGTLRGYNTMESFMKVDKNSLLRDVWRQQLDVSNKPPQTFVLLTFVDLKKHSVIYWFGFPAPMTKTSPIYATNPSAMEIPPALLFKHMSKLFFEYRQKQDETGSSSSSASPSLPLPPPFFAATKSKLVELTTKYLQELAVPGTVDGGGDDTNNPVKSSPNTIIFGFIDPSSGGSGESGEGGDTLSFGWPLRNLLAFLSLKCQLGGQTVSIMSVSSSISSSKTTTTTASGGDTGSDEFWNEQGQVLSKHSCIWQIVVPTPESYNYAPADGDTDTTSPVYKVVGWELNTRHKPGPRSVNLRPLLDETHLAVQAADLNLKLMKWRMIPSLQVEKLQSTKVLLLGAGTLGCSVSRTLVGWGIRDFTFVDNGNVSYSNPVRQNLFTLDDCHYQHGTGRPKAEAAADALKTIAADVTSQGIRLSIPMPGHTDQSPEMLLESVTTLDELVKSTDVVFLLTDTRESRWLPTVMAAAHDKILINAALGLDSWLVMRHGGGINNGNDVGEEDAAATRLGCYFCNDVVAPENSTKNRTLDQQCTVTRPGLAPIASSMAVELYVSMLHHPKQQRAPAPVQKSTDFAPGSDGNASGSSPADSSPLGSIPHQLRGSLVSYTMMNPTVPAFRCCTGCARPVIESYKSDKMKLVSEACASTDGSYLEDLSGLTAFRADAVDKLAEMEVDWDIDDDDEEEII